MAVTQDDIFAGERIKAARKELGISQSELAQSLDITYQQIQKYERGVNRVSLGVLCDICRATRLPITFFTQEDIQCL